MKEADFVVLPMTILENSKICYTVYTKGNTVKVTVRAVGELSQM